jgi:predicted transcriptional regulator
MGKNSGSGRVTLGTRLPRPLVDELKKLAEENRRTFQAELELAVEEYLGRQTGDAQLPEDMERAVIEYLERLAAGRG